MLANQSGATDSDSVMMQSVDHGLQTVDITDNISNTFEDLIV